MKTFLIASSTVFSLIACRSAETSNTAVNIASPAAAPGAVNASASLLPDQSATEATRVLKEYHQALIAGDSTKARSLATGTARTVLEYRFFRSPSDDEMQFTYGAERFSNDTCYIRVHARNLGTRSHKTGSHESGNHETVSTAVMVKVGKDWRVDRILAIE